MTESILYKTVIYCRLSLDDGSLEKSGSIQTQKMMLEKYCRDNNFTIKEVYIDDGYLGLNFERSDFQRLMQDIKLGKIGVVITKDLSRLGRDYIKIGLTGLITEVASVPLMLLGTFAVGTGGDIASQMILDGKSFGEVNLVSATWAGVTNAGLSLVGKGLSIVDKMTGLTRAESIIFGTMINSPLIGLAMAINMGISKHTSVYTVNDLYNNTFGKNKQLVWRW